MLASMGALACLNDIEVCGGLFKHSATKEFLINLDHKEGLKSQPSKQLTKRYQERHRDLFKMKIYGKQNFFDLIPAKARS
jgi:hypothetical protein